MRQSGAALSGCSSNSALAIEWVTAPLRRITSRLFDHYRPEKHYMRGPGPKWHEKHDPAQPAHAHYSGSRNALTLS